MTQPVQFAVFPQTGAVAYAASGFSFIENAKTRASFMPGRWLEYINKDNGQNLLPAGGMPFTPSEGFTSIRLEDLEQLLPKPKR